MAHVAPSRRTDLLIIGAGPFGLALAAEATLRNLDHVVLGKPLEFWRRNMPSGMFLRSGPDWPLDPGDEFTIERFLWDHHLALGPGEPLSVERYLAYADWFRQGRGIVPEERYVERLDAGPGGRDPLVVHLDDASVIQARFVVLALGFRCFAYVPPELAGILPRARFEHACDRTDFTGVSGQRFLIVGGRQSAFEWAALLGEAGAARVDVVFRHDPPRFERSDWAWVNDLMDRWPERPGWFRELPESERQRLADRMFAEGRLKVEPWLEPRIRGGPIRLWPRSRPVRARSRGDGALDVQLDSGPNLAVDRVILATGYRAELDKVPLLARGNVLARIATRDGCPVLSDRMETTVPGLFASSFLATRDFGPFLAFTVSARPAAKILGAEIARRLHRGPVRTKGQ